MKNAITPKPLGVYLLLFLLLFLAMGGIYGGLMLISDPSGEKIMRYYRI